MIALLRGAGLHPETLDDLNPIVTHKSYGRHTVRVAVPSEEADEATGLIRDWESASAAGTARHSRRFLIQLAWAVGAGLLVGAAGFLYAADWGTAAGAFFVAALITLIVISNVAARREAQQGGRG